MSADGGRSDSLSLFLSFTLLHNERNSHGSPLRQAQLPQKNLRHKALEEHIREVGVEVP